MKGSGFRLPLLACLLALVGGWWGCGAPTADPAADLKTTGAEDKVLPALLLVTLDTTRADAVAPEAPAAATPALAALAARGTRFAQAYTTAPSTLPAHASMLTGLYPGGHGIHENSRVLAGEIQLLPELLRQRGYRTAAFISGYPLSRRFGLARGFEHYDDALGEGGIERDARSTTDRALAHLEAAGQAPFLWVHYFDPHHPYAPPEPHASRFADDPYRGEIAFMDAELGKLLTAFEARFAHAEGGWKAVIVGDHGEGLGDHGETYHGNLLYQSVMRVPLLIVGSAVPAGEVRWPVSTRRVFDTLLGWSRGEEEPGLLEAPAPPTGEDSPVLGEAMQPYLQYGWRPQTMAVVGRYKTILAVGDAAETELYDVVADPDESRDLRAGAPGTSGAREVAAQPELVQAALRQAFEALREYPLPARSTTPGAASTSPTAPLSEEDHRRLAALGYVASSGAPPKLRADAPSPRRMTHLFADLDEASRLFVNRRYAEAIPLLAKILREDPGNLSIALRLAAAHSALGHDAEALTAFQQARAIDADSSDLRHYLGLHHLRAGRLAEAARLLEESLAADPHRLPALEALAEIRERQGRLREAVALHRRALAVQRSGTSLARVGEISMALGDTLSAIAAFEEAREFARSEPGAAQREGGGFEHHLELGVCYLAAGRLAEAASALDEVPAGHPGYPMALFKRAQIAALLGEPDRQERLRLARQHADATTRPLLEAEPLFR